MHFLETTITDPTQPNLGASTLTSSEGTVRLAHLIATHHRTMPLARLLSGFVVCVAAVACGDDASSGSDTPAGGDQNGHTVPARSDGDGGTKVDGEGDSANDGLLGNAGEDDAGEADLPGTDQAGGENSARGSEVPSTWGDYCQDIAAIWCEREQTCPDGTVDKCETAFTLGCCEEDNVCGASFGAGVSNAEYEACLTDTANDECGASAPESCRALMTDAPQPGAPSDTLAAVCSASCEAQDAVGCAGGASLSECVYSCLLIPDFIAGCDDAWIDLNACMATAPLMCDTVNGGASVSYDDCGKEIDAFGSCQAG